MRRDPLTALPIAITEADEAEALDRSCQQLLAHEALSDGERARLRADYTARQWYLDREGLIALSSRIRLAIWRATEGRR